MTTVLLVDDDPFVLRSLLASLRRKRPSWELVSAASGFEALAQLADRMFDVIVSDMRMPGMNGAELLTQVRASYPRTRRVVLTGEASLDTAMKVAHEALNKPTMPLDLVACLERVLTRFTPIP